MHIYYIFACNAALWSWARKLLLLIVFELSLRCGWRHHSLWKESLNIIFCRLCRLEMATTRRGYCQSWALCDVRRMGRKQESVRANVLIKLPSATVVEPNRRKTGRRVRKPHYLWTENVFRSLAPYIYGLNCDAKRHHRGVTLMQPQCNGIYS